MTIDLKSIKARLEAATPGPWQIYYEAIVDCIADKDTGYDFTNKIMCSVDLKNRYNNNSFVAHAPTDIAQLVEALEKCREAVAKLVFLTSEESFTKQAVLYQIANDSYKEVFGE